MNNLKLHHFCYSVRSGNLGNIIELFKLLGFRIGFQPQDKSFVMLHSDEKKIDVQIIQSDDQIINEESKLKTHIAFLSESPGKDIEEIKNWAEENNITFRTGSWSETQHWFDLPEIFINFVVEFMDYKVITEAKKTN